MRTGAHVERIEVEGGRAVAWHVGGSRIEARREVLLAAGAIGSPRVLLHSGIGPARHLKAVGVDVVVDPPCVGENLHDHMDLFVVSECSGDFSFDASKPCTCPRPPARST